MIVASTARGLVKWGWGVDETAGNGPREDDSATAEVKLSEADKKRVRDMLERMKMGDWVTMPQAADSAAGMFHVVAEIARVLQDAHGRGQKWSSAVERLRKPDGSSTDGYEFRVRIEPSSGEPTLPFGAGPVLDYLTKPDHERT